MKADPFSKKLFKIHPKNYFFFKFSRKTSKIDWYNFFLNREGKIYYLTHHRVNWSNCWERVLSDFAFSLQYLLDFCPFCVHDVLQNFLFIQFQIILGDVNVSILNRNDKVRYKDDYEKFKLILNVIGLAMSFLNLIFNNR